MKTIIYIAAFLLTITAITYSQSVMEFETGSALTNDSGADISVDEIIMNGTYTGGGTINGNIAYILNLTVLIEGFYNPSTDTMISDTVRVYLRNISSPYNVIDSSDASIKEGIGSFIFSNITNGTNYYLDIRHRNSIETWSAAGQSFASYFKVYDFTNANTQAYGNNMIQVNTSPIRFALYSGDVNQDGFVELSDVVSIYNDAGNFVTGYANTDVNGDNLIDLSDLLITYNNAAAFVSKVTP